MQGIIKLNQIPETCKDCPFHTYSSGCRVKRKAFEGFKAARPDWCPIEVESSFEDHTITEENSGIYKKKPVRVRAWQYNGDFSNCPGWVVDEISNSRIYTENIAGTRLCKRTKIKTLEGSMTLRRGDYIIKGVYGEIYPCKPYIFKETYKGVK